MSHQTTRQVINNNSLADCLEVKPKVGAAKKKKKKNAGNNPLLLVLQLGH